LTVAQNKPNIFRRAVLPALVAATFAAGLSGPTLASSHREAPFIASS
jgi:hypothetical protein